MATLETLRAVDPHNCPDTCGMTVRLLGGRPVAVDGEPELDIHTDDAVSRGITNRVLLRVHNDRGWFKPRAIVGDSVRDGVVVATGIWWNKHVEGNRNANATTSTRLADLGGGSTLFDNLVDVEPLES